MKTIRTNMQIQAKSEKGYILLGVIVLVAVAAVIVGSSLELTSTSSRTTLAGMQRSNEYYQAEESLSAAASWLREQSTGMVLPFSRNNFYTFFDKSSPSYGTNDTSTFKVHSKIKMQGTSSSIMLTNDSSMGASAFPATTDSMTGAAFSASSVFPSASLGDKKVRVTLVDAVPVDASKDFGDTDSGNATPQTDFSPIYRVDAMDSTTTGSHLYGYLVGSLQYDFGIGFYGKNYMEARQPCDSYLSNNGAYSNASKRSNCSIGSNTEIRIHQNTNIYGTARTNGSITASSPYGGKVCSDFASGCPNPGQTCTGAACNVAALPNYNTWNVYCPTNQGSVAPGSTLPLTVTGNNPNQKCWSSVTVGAKEVVTLTSTNFPYFIDTLNIANNGRLNFAPSPATGTITLYVRTITGDKFNGGQVFNTNNKPYQLRIHYLGTNALTLNGTAAMNAFLVAPYAPVNVQGNFDFAGGIKALELTFTGNGSLHYDESGDITTLQDISYKLRNVSQYYR